MYFTRGRKKRERTIEWRFEPRLFSQHRHTRTHARTHEENDGKKPTVSPSSSPSIYTTLFLSFVSNQERKRER